MDGDSGLGRLLQKLFSNVKAAQLCPMLLRPKELMNLLEQLAAGAGVFVKNGRLGAQPGRLDGG